MQDHQVEEQQKRGHLPPLAPRNKRPSSRDRALPSSSGRPPRLSHRSRAGCWTCRGRKVKCDENHPKCGQCARLNRECDWDHRWNFSDATSSTQGKYSHVKTTGNTVWDPAARKSPLTNPAFRPLDTLPEFATLLTDEDREQKAVTQRPGTFSVVATPESFLDLPEYASTTSLQSSKRTASQSSRGGYGSARSGISRSSTRIDPNVVVLERFEDSSASTIAAPLSVSDDASRRGSLTDLANVSISTPPVVPSISTASRGPPTPADDQVLAHFRNYVVPRLVNPQQDLMRGVISQGATRNALEVEAARFPPLYHAICALSALNMSYNGRSSLEEALQHYHSALAPTTMTSSSTNLMSDGVLLRHFLLFIYDICIPMASDDGGADMWALNLDHLRQIAVQRRNAAGRDPHGYTIWSICELDMYACLLGCGNCDFVRTLAEQNMLPALDQQVPNLASALSNGSFLPNEALAFPPILRLNEGVVLRTAKLAQTAQAFRSEAASPVPPSPGMRARWQATVTQLQNDMTSFWLHTCPQPLQGESSHAAEMLPERVHAVFQNALLLYNTSILYLRTSMFPNQRRIPVAGQQEVLADTERRAALILSTARRQLETNVRHQRTTVFPVFIAGFASMDLGFKQAALDAIRGFENSGIGQNTFRTRQLLVAVFQEQSRLYEAGGRPEDADWLVIARKQGFEVVNCGL